MDYISANLDLQKLYNEIKCNSYTIYRFNGVWEGPDPLTPIVPLFLLQLTIAVLSTRLLITALTPFNQPTFVAEILVSLEVMEILPSFCRVSLFVGVHQFFH